MKKTIRRSILAFALTASLPYRSEAQQAPAAPFAAKQLSITTGILADFDGDRRIDTLYGTTCGAVPCLYVDYSDASRDPQSVKLPAGALEGFQIQHQRSKRTPLLVQLRLRSAAATKFYTVSVNRKGVFGKPKKQKRPLADAAFIVDLPSAPLTGGDLDGDGAPEQFTLVEINGAAAFSIQSSRGGAPTTASFPAPTAYPFTPIVDHVRPQLVATYDADNDGDYDALVLARFDNPVPIFPDITQLMLYRNDGVGHLLSPEVVTLQGNFVEHLGANGSPLIVDLHGTGLPVLVFKNISYAFRPGFGDFSAIEIAGIL